MSESLITLQAHPLFGIFATIAAYTFANTLWQRFGNTPFLHPVLIATALIGLMLVATGMSYDVYFEQAYLLNEALAVVIVLLAVPLWRQLHLIVQAGGAITIGLITGSVVAVVSALALPSALGAGHELLATLAPKSATAAVAVEVADHLGGVAGMTAVIVIATGIFGAVCGPAILDLIGVKDDRAKGFALGVASHAIGTARAFQISDVAGAFASLGMILNALLTVILAPLAVALVVS